MRNFALAAAAMLILGVTNLSYAQKQGKNMKTQTPHLTTATFAGGCFWCMQPPYEKLPGVISVTVGYTGGTRANPTYEEVSAGNTGHAEAVQIVYDGSKTTYSQLLDVFWHNINPTTLNQQFADKGSQYRTAIFYHDEEQKKLALESKKKQETSGKFEGPLVTEITPATTFYPGEEYHQKYYKKNPLQYKYYHHASGRQEYIEKVWGKSEEKKK